MSKSMTAHAAPSAPTSSRMKAAHHSRQAAFDHASARHARWQRTGRHSYIYSYAADSGNLQRYAERYGFGALMESHGFPSGAYACAGRSAFSSPDGKLVIAAPGVGSYLVIASGGCNDWSGELVDLDI